MESAKAPVGLPKYHGPRVKLELGKYPVQRVIHRAAILEFSIQLGSVTIVIPAPISVDVREGDLLSLYTEVALNVSKSTNNN